MPSCAASNREGLSAPRPEPRWNQWSFVLAVVLILAGCTRTGSEMRIDGDPPPLDSLEVATILRFSGSFLPFGVAGLPNCDIVLVGGSWGTLARIRADGSVDEVLGRADYPEGRTSLEIGDGAQALAWGPQPPYLADVEGDLSTSMRPVPEHPWGVRLMGPAVPLPGGRYAIAAVSDRSLGRPTPRPWRASPLIQIVDTLGTVVGEAGQIINRGGQFRSWLAARAVLGNRGDTLRALRLSTGILETFAPPDPDGGYALIDRTRLPAYFNPPPIHEEVLSYPWITFGGEESVLAHLSQVEAAAFGGNRLYAIRNYAAAWFEIDNPRVTLPGRWKPTEQGLEIYDLEGRRLRSFSLPSSDPDFLRADSRGRIFIRFGRSLISFRDPTYQGPACPATSPEIMVSIADTFPRLANRS